MFWEKDWEQYNSLLVNNNNLVFILIKQMYAILQTWQEEMKKLLNCCFPERLLLM